MKKTMLKRIVCFALVLVMTFAMLPMVGNNVKAAKYTGVVRQTDSPWQNYYYGGDNLANTGCGLFSLVNCVGYLTGELMDIPSLASWAHSTGGFNKKADGTYKYVLYPLVEAKYGEQFGIGLDCNTDGEGWWAGAESTLLKTRLQQGYVAIGNVYNHFVAIVDYDPATNKYHVYDSAPRAHRGTNVNGGDLWITQSQFSTGTMDLFWFCFVYAKDTTDHKLDGQDPVDMGKDFYARIANESIGKYFTDKNGEVWAEGLSGDANQVWHFMRQSNGEYLIGNSATSKFLQVKDGVYKDGSRLVTGSMDYEDHQKFYVYYMYNNFYLMPAGKDMTVDIDCTLFHTQICGTSTQNGIHEPSFKARSLNIEVVSVYDGTRETSELGDSFVAEIKNVASGKYITADGASLIGADKNGLDTQKWTFTRLPSGCYTIVSKSENLAIDVAHTLLAEGTPVDMYDLTNLNAQRFFLIKKDGSYYLKPTYTVNTLHYNSADNQFYTYATADDSAKLAAQKFELIIEGDAESELILKDTSALSKDGTELNKVAIGQTASTILSNFENKEAVIKNAKGDSVSSTANVGTGYTVDLVVNGEKVDSVTIVILGEVTGDGLLNTTDYLKIKSSLNGGEALTGAYKKAADVDGNNELNGTDYMRVKSHFLGNYNLYK